MDATSTRRALLLSLALALLLGTPSWAQDDGGTAPASGSEIPQPPPLAGDEGSGPPPITGGPNAAQMQQTQSASQSNIPSGIQIGPNTTLNYGLPNHQTAPGEVAPGGTVTHTFP